LQLEGTGCTGMRFTLMLMTNFQIFLSFSLFQAVTPPVVLLQGCGVLVRLTSHCNSFILVCRGVLSLVLRGECKYLNVNNVNNKRTEALKAGGCTEWERSHWDAARMPVSHSAENTRTMTGNGKRTTNALVQTYPEWDNPEYEQEDPEIPSIMPRTSIIRSGIDHYK